MRNQKHDLEAQVKEFEAKRDDLHQQYDKAKQELTEIGETKGSEAAYFAYRAQKCNEELEALKLKRRR